MTTPHPEHSLYFFRMNELMRELGHHPERAKRIAQDVHNMGEVPCIVCGNPLTVAPFPVTTVTGKRYKSFVRMFCDTCSNITNPYPFKAQAIHATKEWLGRVDPHAQLVNALASVIQEEA